MNPEMVNVVEFFFFGNDERLEARRVIMCVGGGRGGG